MTAVAGEGGEPGWGGGASAVQQPHPWAGLPRALRDRPPEGPGVRRE